MQARSTIKLLAGLGFLAMFAAGLACGSLTDTLAMEECLVTSAEEDCGGALGCYIHQPISTAGGAVPINQGLGWCLETPECVQGAQPYCPCRIDAVNNGWACDAPPTSGSRMATGLIPCWNPAIQGDCWCVTQQVCDQVPELERFMQ